MRRIIFLDVDGVLNSDQFMIWCQNNNFDNWWEYGLLDQHCLMLLRNLVRRSDARVVVCSSWRIHPRFFEVLKTQLSLYGIEVYGTTNQDFTVDRASQITEWLITNPTDEYVVLDDEGDHDYPPSSEVYRHLVRTDTRVGLQPPHVELALRILNIKETEV